MKSYKILLLIAFIISSFSVNAQYYSPKNINSERSIKDKPLKDRLHFGGTLGLQFGSFTSIYLSPILYYDVTEMLMVGAGFNYIYQQYDYGFTEYKSSIYGPKLSVILKPFEKLMLSSDYEYNFYDRNFDNYGNIVNPYWQSTWYVGVGYFVPMGRKGGMYISMSYDLLYNESRSYYSTAWKPTIGVYF